MGNRQTIAFATMSGSGARYGNADIDFWARWREAGFVACLAPRVVVGHMEDVISWPGKDLSKVYQSPGDYDEKGEVSFGRQIRNYTLQPYTLVKDTRTGHESGQVQAILDGDIDDFIQAYLKMKLEQRSKAK